MLHQELILQLHRGLNLQLDLQLGDLVIVEQHLLGDETIRTFHHIITIQYLHEIKSNNQRNER